MSYITSFNQRHNITINEIKYEIPSIQRAIKDDNVQKIYEFQNDFYAKHNTYLINGTISIAIDSQTGVE
jgi:NAD(P)H-nitrite reductase large subunit